MSELAKALAKAQGEMGSALKDAQNPHFRSSYATLASSIDAAKKALSTNGLSVIQYGGFGSSGNPVLFTRLLHVSGEFIEGAIPLFMVKQDMQGLGSAWTYARRYGFQAIIGLAQDDDDGNAASRSSPPITTTPQSHPAPTGKPNSALVLGFGKHKGKKVSELDDGYIDFLLRDLQDPNRKYPLKEKDHELLATLLEEKSLRDTAPKLDEDEQIPF